MEINSQLLALQQKRTVLTAKMETHLNLLKFYLELVQEQKTLMEEHLQEINKVQLEIAPLVKDFLKT